MTVLKSAFNNLSSKHLLESPGEESSGTDAGAASLDPEAGEARNLRVPRDPTWDLAAAVRRVR